MKYIKNSLSMFKFNFSTLLKFEIIFKLLLGLMFMPLILGGFNLAMKITGHNYLTIENIVSFLMNPITVIVLLILLFFLTIITLFDISTMIIIYDASYHKYKIKLKDAIKISLNKCKKQLKIRNVPVAFMLLFLIPILNLAIGSNVITAIKIPEFIMEYITANTGLSIIFIITYVVLAIILLRWIYSIHYMVLEDLDFKEARKNSKILSKGNKLKDTLKIFFVEIIISLVFVIFIFLGIIIVYAINKFLITIKVIESFLITIIWMYIVLFLIITAILSNALSYALISSLFYTHKFEKNESIVKLDYSNSLVDNKKNIVLRIVFAITLTLILLFGNIITYQFISGKQSLNIEFIRKVEITAHRGASVLYPENTMMAFKGAKKLGADWIELDVQQSKDRKIVVSHDSNLSRVTGVNKDIIDLNYAEISLLDAGSFFNEKFKGEKIPLLEDVLRFAKENNIKLNIELKPTGKEVDFEKQVVELIKKYNYESKCVVTSQIYSVLENTKKIAPKIKTIYVMSIAIGKITDLKSADGFSVEATNVNSSLVNQIHTEGKELFVWTVNTEEGINQMIEMDIDNIITDNIELGKKLIIQSKQSDIITEFLKLFSN